MKPPGVKVVSPVGDAEVQDAYARTILWARHLREKGESPDSRPPLRPSKDVNEGPPTEDQETISNVCATLGLSIPKSMYPRLPMAVGIAFSLIAEGKTEHDRFVPAMLGLSEKQAAEAAAAVVRVLLKYRPGSWWELVWCLAVQQTSDGKRGPKKRTRTSMQGILFVEDVELKLREMGSRGKLGAAIRLVWEENPNWYGQFPEASLRELYSAARKRRNALKAKLCGNS
jgi:hypothetical protein